ncbi:MAG: energy-coupling factor ABC transporter permease, partial [Candidatus Thiodiazotropha sp. (ex Lucinoma borealis)]|nr:energy-coupling factor ABC transporter permease [Candidatus Thiodiazotropha sp. (ex Lucinoma borealis)]
MHIPDGFIAPQFYLPAYLLAGGAWVWAARGIRRTLDEETIPRLAVITALAYAIGLVMAKRWASSRICWIRCNADE